MTPAEAFDFGYENGIERHCGGLTLKILANKKLYLAYLKGWKLGKEGKSRHDNNQPNRSSS